MTLAELKDSIKKNILPSNFMIFIRKENTYLTKQYIEALSKLATEGINKISSIFEPQQSSLTILTTSSETLHILNTEVFDERAEDYSQFEHIIVICDQVDKSIIEATKDYVIKFPKLVEWQIFDYAKNKCPSIHDDELLWLIKVSNNSIERVINELDKIVLFAPELQRELFNSIMFDPQSDLYSIDLFKVTDALINGDTLTLFDFLTHNDYESLDPVMLANRALTSLKNIVLITQNPKITKEVCGVSSKYYYYIKSTYSSLNIEAAKAKIKFLTKFDLDLKTSKLNLSKRNLLNYLICNLTYKIKA